MPRNNRTYPPISERFWKNVEKRSDDECWPWKGCVSGSGYGHLSVKGKPNVSTRLSLMIAGVDVPVGASVRHMCDVNYPPGDTSYRLCVNPRHLVVGTAKENSRDCLDRGRAPNAKLTRAIADDIRAERASGVTSAEIALKHGISESAVHYIICNRSWVDDKPKTLSVRKAGMYRMPHSVWLKADDGMLRCKNCGDLWDGTGEPPWGCKIRYPNPASIPAGSWTVERHGGRVSDAWRVCAWGTELDAGECFAKLQGVVRQGGIRIVDPSGAVRSTWELPFKRPNPFGNRWRTG